MRAKHLDIEMLTEAEIQDLQNYLYLIQNN